MCVSAWEHIEVLRVRPQGSRVPVDSHSEVCVSTGAVDTHTSECVCVLNESLQPRRSLLLLSLLYEDLP